MAALGTLDTRWSNTAYIRKLSVYAATNAAATGARTSLVASGSWLVYTRGALASGSYIINPTLGYIAGTVTELTVPVANAMVVAYDRRSLLPVAKTFSNADGTFQFKSIFDVAYRDYFVVAFDPEGGTSYNALIYDKVQAV